MVSPPPTSQPPNASPQDAPEPADPSSLHLLIVDDDDDVRLALTTYFSMAGYQVEEAADGAAALDKMMQRQPAYDLVMLDVMLPGMNGFEVLEASQERGLTSPVLMISGRGSQEDLLKGFGLGAHDYIVKPFDPDELMARIRAILGRTMPPSSTPMRTFSFGDIEVNFSTSSARRGDAHLPLSELEFDILSLLIQNREHVVSRKRLLEDGLHIDEELILHTLSPDILADKIEEVIASLRHKIEPTPHAPVYLTTVYGQGYRFTGGEAPSA